MKNLILKSVVLCLLLIFVRQVSACICGQLPLTAKAEMRDTDAVFVGKVVGISELKGLSSDGLSYTKSFAIRLKVTKSFKGLKANEITISSGNSDCDMHFSKGEDWLVFAWFVEGNLVTGGCSRTQLAKSAIQDLRCLKRGVCVEKCLECIEERGAVPAGEVIPRATKKPSK